MFVVFCKALIAHVINKLIGKDDAIDQSWGTQAWTGKLRLNSQFLITLLADLTRNIVYFMSWKYTHIYLYIIITAYYKID